MKTFSSHTLVSLILTILAAVWFYSVNNLVLKTNLDLREGPGSFFELVLRLNAGASVQELSQESGWKQVKVGEYTGWIPDHPLYFEQTQPSDRPQQRADPRDRMRQMFSEQSGSNEVVYATPTQVAAAVKGFARRYKADRGEQTRVDFTDEFDKRINTSDYRSFKRERFGMFDWYASQRRFPINRDTVPAFNPEYDQIGWGIANVLAEQGLYIDYELQRYVNYVGLLVTETSHRYEVPIQVHILDKDEVAGYAVPNGIVFISKGALKTMRNEAELAFFLAHELAHVVLQHGIEETKRQRVRISRDDAFQQLDALMAETRTEEEARVIRELTEWADQVYEYLTSGKLNEYEYTADFWGMIYMYRAGYDPKAAVEFLERIRSQQGDFEYQIGDLEWEGASVKQRVDNLRMLSSRLNLLPSINQRFEDAFIRMQRRIN